MIFNKYRLEDITDKIGDGIHGTPEYDDNGDFYFVNGNNLVDGDIVFKNDTKRINEEQYLKNKRDLNKNTLLVSINGTLGNVAKYNNEKIILGKSACYINVKDGYNVDYVYFVFESPEFKKYLQYGANGTTIKNVPLYAIRNYEISIPSKDNQDKIVKILKSIEDKIKLNNKINNNLQKLINEIFISKFVNYDGYSGEYKSTEIGDIPSDWNVDNFGNIISFSNGYGWDSKDMLESNQPDTYKVFKMGNIKIGGGINKEKTKSWILKEKCLGLEQFLSKKGDVLMCMTDMKSSENPLLGHTALIDRDDEFVVNQRVGIIRCDKDIKWPFIYTMSNLPFFISSIRSKAHSGVQVNLTTSGICDTKVIIPDKDSLEEFYKNVTPMYEKIFILNNEIENLEQLRDTLLPKLMNGEIDLDNIEI